MNESALLRSAGEARRPIEMTTASRSSGHARLRVAVDGVIYSYQQHGGISRILSSVLPRLCALDEDLRIELWSWKKLAQPVPEHRHLTHRRVPSLPTSRKSRPAAVQRFLRRLSARANEQLRRRTVAASDADLWHATLYWHPPGWRGRIVTTVYDLKEELFPQLGERRAELLRYKRDAILAADHILCISETTRRDLISCYDIAPRRLSVTPLAIEPDVYRATGATGVSDLGVTGPFILFVGRRDPFKNFDLLMEAYRRWHRRPEIRLVLAGPPLLASERRKLEDRGIGDRLVHLPEASDSILARLYRSAEALVYPSLYEGFGLPLLEAMACGCPLVAARIPSSTELASGVAVFFEPAEPDSLVEALEAAVTEGRASPRVAEGLARSARYSWDETARSTLEIYRKVST